MKTKKLISLLLCLLMIISVSAPISAVAYTWSGDNTFFLTSGENWKTSSSARDKKESTNNIVQVKTQSLTMWNNPTFRIVSNTGDTPNVYSKSFTMGNTGNTKSSASNTATKGTTCYASLKPAFLQTKTDSIRFTFSAD